MSNNILTHTSANIRENYSSLDGLRAYAAVGIVLMHVQGATDKPCGEGVRMLTQNCC